MTFSFMNLGAGYNEFAFMFSFGVHVFKVWVFKNVRGEKCASYLLTLGTPRSCNVEMFFPGACASIEVIALLA